MTSDSIPGPPGFQSLGGVAIDQEAIAGLTEGDTVAFKFVGGELVPFVLCSSGTHKLTAGNGDYIDLNLEP